MDTLENLHLRLSRLETEAAVRQAIALFSDAVGRNDREAFLELWAPFGIWEIGEPYPTRAEGAAAIGAMLDRLMQGWEFFVQLTHSTVVELAPDLQRATARSEIREFARQADRSRSYDNFAVYEDALVQDRGRWRFALRRYHYIWIADAPITGRGFALPPRLGRGP